MHSETHLALHHLRAADLRAEADAHRLATQAKRPHAISDPARLDPGGGRPPAGLRRGRPLALPAAPGTDPLPDSSAVSALTAPFRDVTGISRSPFGSSAFASEHSSSGTRNTVAPSRCAACVFRATPPTAPTVPSASIVPVPGDGAAAREVAAGAVTVQLVDDPQGEQQPRARPADVGELQRDLDLVVAELQVVQRRLGRRVLGLLHLRGVVLLDLLDAAARSGRPRRGA